MIRDLLELIGKMFSRKPAEPVERTYSSVEGVLPIEATQLFRVYGGQLASFEKYVEHLNDAMSFYEINTPKRVAAFLAQVGHESARMTRVVESLNYSASGLAKTWPNRYRNPDGTPNTLAHSLARNPEAIANNAYATRMGNGGAISGDGWKYRGRGLIQLTGKDNYLRVSMALGHDFVKSPDDLMLPKWAVRSATQYWSDRKLNAFADRGDMVGMTRLINGGLNGLEDRSLLYAKALEVFE